jgi:hypothetical protein
MAESKKSKKFGRNANWCKAYTTAMRQQQSHARRVYRHLFVRGHLTDAKAVHYWNNLSPLARGRAGLPQDCNVAPVKSKHKKIPPRFWGPAMGGDERAHA